jgi:hypothetical protein
MHICRNCDTRLVEQQHICPICGERIGNGADRTYPVYKKISSRGTKFRFWSIMALIVLTVATVIVNIAVGGRTWSLYVVVGSIINYQTFFSRKQVESSLIRKFIVIVLSVCILLIIIQFLSRSEVNAIQIIVPILLWGTLILSAFLYFFDFPAQKSHILPILFTICLSLICIGTGLWLFNTIRWPSIVLMSISTFIVLFAMLFYRKPVWAELRKKLHR